MTRTSDHDPALAGEPSPGSTGRSISAPPHGSPRRARSKAARRVQAALAAQRDELVRYGAVAGIDADPKTVHKMRVAIRRSRAVLHAAGPALDRSSTDRVREELSWLAEHLAPARDADVLIANVTSELVSFGPDAIRGRSLVASLDQRRRTAHDRVRDAVDSERFQRLLAALEPEATERWFVGAGTTVCAMAGRELRAARKHARRMADPPSDADLHRLRILVKRARYAAELLGASNKRVARFLDAAAALQALLGEHQDAVVAGRTLRDVATDADRIDAALVAGRLIERDELRCSRVRGEVPKAWKRFHRSGRRALRRRS